MRRKTRNAYIIMLSLIAGLLCIIIGCKGNELKSTSITSDEHLQRKILEIIAEIRNGNTDGPGNLIMFLNDNANALPILMKHSRDENRDVRYNIIGAIARLRDPRSIDVLCERLEDSDQNVRNEAFTGLWGLDRKVLKINLPPGKIDLLVRYMNSWDYGSRGAALLLAELDAANTSVAIQNHMKEAEKINDADNKQKRLLAPKTFEYCLMALTKMGEPEAKRRVLEMIRQDNVDNRKIAIHCIKYAKNKDLAILLVSVLDDCRDAEDVGIPDAHLLVRIRDLAIETIADVMEYDMPFRVRRGQHYTDEQAHIVHRRFAPTASP